MTQGAQIHCSITTQRGGMEWEVGRRFRREGTCIHLWPIHVHIWQKPTQYCKAIILRLKIKKKNIKHDSLIKISFFRDFPGSSVVRALPSNAGGACSFPGQGAKISHTQWPKTQHIKQKQYCNKFKKDFKNGPPQKNIF